MLISSVKITRFKRIDEASLDLKKINVLVGGNNSGKSCILQGIHFGVALAQARRIAGANQFPSEQLRYCPTDNFLDLCYKTRLHEGTSIEADYFAKSGEIDKHAKVSLTRGRNGVVKAVMSGDELLSDIADPKGFFSIYVPGLAGVSIREEYRSELVVNNGIARGDANLFLRNLLLRLERSEERKTRFNNHFNKVFPEYRVETTFSEPDDLTISSYVIQNDGLKLPLDMVGTGLLQAIQLIAYVTMYQPRLLLLDEPDAHLHPSNQRRLAQTLQSIVIGSETKVIVATHSRHLLDAFSGSNDAQLYWVRDGVATLHSSWGDVAVLMDLGALDTGEQLLNGAFKYLIWTEDDDTKPLKMFLTANGVADTDALVFSYKASSKVDAAKLMGSFLAKMRPGVRTIIHRDRDFMSDLEIGRLRKKYDLNDSGSMRLFITSGSDIEAYFTSKEHLANALQITEEEARIQVESVIQESQNEFALKFQSKRSEIKFDLYKADPDSCPKTETLLQGSVVPIEKALGKLLLKRLGPHIQASGKNAGVILRASTALIDPAFCQLLEDDVSLASSVTEQEIKEQDMEILNTQGGKGAYK